MSARLWVLGSVDPEMEAIEDLLMQTGEEVRYATVGGERVRSGTAYQMDPIPGDQVPWGGIITLVECDAAAPIVLVPRGYCRVHRVDHHRSDDPGYGRPPAEFLSASSLGQVISELARFDALPQEWGRYGAPKTESGGFRPHYVRGWMIGMARGEAAVPHDLVLAAAADHCLAAAYRGECPGVVPDDLMQWRVRTRAAHQGRIEGEILADIERARETLREAPGLVLYKRTPAPSNAVTCADLRGLHVPELPEASAREGQCFVANGLPGPDGRVKVVCQSGTPEQIRAFMTSWAPAHGLTDIYGDPARGFAGGYVPGAR